MKELEHLKNMLCDEVRKINAQGELNPTTLEIADTVVDIIKDIMEITEKEGRMGYNDEGSYRGNYNYNTRPSYNYYDNGYDSYNHRNNSYGYDNGYSRHTATDQMIDKLEMMMQDASSKDKATIQRCIEELKN